jgi:hypothetical protein
MDHNNFQSSIFHYLTIKVDSSNAIYYQKNKKREIIERKIYPLINNLMLTLFNPWKQG